MPGPAQPRSVYRHFAALSTRWSDNDVYGHVNNALYYGYFDTAINAYLISAGGLNILESPVIGLCVESQCRYFSPVKFPDALEAGLRVAHLGRSSVRYELGIFVAGQETASAEGHFVHVFVDRAARRPVELPARLRTSLEALR